MCRRDGRAPGWPGAGELGAVVEGDGDLVPGIRFQGENKDICFLASLAAGGFRTVRWVPAGEGAHRGRVGVRRPLSSALGAGR